MHEQALLNLQNNRSQLHIVEKELETLRSELAAQKEKYQKLKESSDKQIQENLDAIKFQRISVIEKQKQLD